MGLAYPVHVAELAPRLRKADVREISACSGREPVAALMDGVCQSRIALALEANGQVEALFGVVESPGGFGGIWLLGSPWLTKHPIILYKGMKHFLPLLEKGFEAVGNLISMEQTVYRKFLKRFEFVFHVEHSGPEGFLLFARRTDHV